MIGDETDATGPPSSTSLKSGGAMTPRDPSEEGRGSTNLEFFLDLVFATAVGLSSSVFHSSASDGHLASGLVGYAMVFFAIWWAWMNFTWFASAYDCDDAWYRLTALVQMGGVLLLAGGVPDAMTEQDFTLIVIGYVVMRVAMISQWLRAAAADPSRRHVALTYAAGIAVVQVGWVAWLFVPSAAAVPVFVLLAVCELLVPVIAERRGTTPWNAAHITDRYGSFTLIVLGETVLASTNAIVSAREDLSHPGVLVVVSASTLVLAGALWWLYFDRPQEHLLGSLSEAMRWGYGHYLIFAAAATLSVGVEVELDFDTGSTVLSEFASSALMTVPVAAFILLFWVLSLRRLGSRALNVTVLVGTAAIVCTALTPYAMPLAAVLTVGVAAAAAVAGRRV